jgi:hypothetical protein
MKNKKLILFFFILFFSFSLNPIYGKLREHFTFEFDVGYGLSLEPKIISNGDKETLKFKSHWGHIFQVYPSRNIGIQVEIRVQRVEVKREYKGLGMRREYLSHPYTFLNLFYKFNSFEDKKIYPYFLVGIGWQDQFDVMRGAYKTGIGIKYNFLHEETKKGTTFFVLNLNLGLFYIFPDSSMEFFRRKGHLSLYSGVEIGI